MENGNKIIIDLSRDPRDANVFSDNKKVIQRHALTRLGQLLRQSLAMIESDAPVSRQHGHLTSGTGVAPIGVGQWGALLPNPQPNIVYQRRHDAISIHGQRGSGKTTFILNALDALMHNPEFAANNGFKQGEVRSLGIIDPTLIETKEHVIVTLLTKIKQEVDYARLLRTDRGADAAYDTWELSLRDLAEGLSLLDDIGSKTPYGEDWQDAQYILERGLGRAASGTGFEQKFHRFVKNSLEFIGIRAFVLAFDDIDTAFDRGWNVLEAIRKYLTTPFLITIVLGDLDLYSMLVRNRQWSSFGDTFLKQEQWLQEKGAALAPNGGVSRMAAISAMVDKLESQYLLKVLKPENRINLEPVSKYVDWIVVKREKPETDMALSNFLDEYAKDLFAVRSQLELDLFREAILRQPTRTLVQLLQGRRLRDADPKKDKQVERDFLRMTFASELLAHGLRSDEMGSANSARLIANLATWLGDKDWKEAYRFRPDQQDETLNLAVFAIASSLVAGFEGEPVTMVDYQLKIARAREWAQWQSEKDAFAAYIKAARLHSDIKLPDVVGFTLAFDRARKKRNAEHVIRYGAAPIPFKTFDSRGWLELYGLRGGKVECQQQDSNTKTPQTEVIQFSNLLAALKKLKSDILPFLEEFNSKVSSASGANVHLLKRFICPTYEQMADQTSGAAAIVMALPLIRIQASMGTEAGVYAFDALLAVVAELLRLPSDEHLKGRIRGLLKARFAAQAYGASEQHVDASTEASPPQDESSTDDLLSDEDEETTESQSPDSESEQLVVRLVESLVVWREKIGTENGPVEAPVTLARAWARFMETCVSIEGKLKPLKTRYLGVLMHRYIVAYFNALLVESLRAAGDHKDVELRNPVTDDGGFLSNLSCAESVKEAPWLFKSLFSCPLWAFFLDPAGKAVNGWSVLDRQLHYLNAYQERIDSTQPQAAAAAAKGSRSRSAKQPVSGTVAHEGVGTGSTSLPDRTFLEVTKAKLHLSGKEVNVDLEFDNLYHPLNALFLQGNSRPRPIKMMSSSADNSGN
ncbi:hypothetical protein [Azospirillum sp. sgz302134]